MSTNWRFCTIENSGKNSRVTIYADGNTYYAYWTVKEFIQEKYPDIQLQKKDEKWYVYILINRLLNDGWEPFTIASVSATSMSSNEVYGFRMKSE